MIHWYNKNGNNVKGHEKIQAVRVGFSWRTNNPAKPLSLERAYVHVQMHVSRNYYMHWLPTYVKDSEKAGEDDITRLFGLVNDTSCDPTSLTMS